MWIQTGVTVRKRLSWVVTSVTLTFDLWPWPFAWTSLLTMVITPENFMMIRWWEHGEKGVTDRQTDRRTENTICRAAWSQLKMYRGQETYPIRVNTRYEMNWANSFFKKYQKPCLQTDGQTDGQTSGWIQYTPILPSVEQGYNMFMFMQELSCMDCLI